MNIFLLFACILFAFGCASKKEISSNSDSKIEAPVISFEVTEGILHPESVIYSPKFKVIFVSNIASGNPLETERVGYISQISTEGKMIQTKWVTGLKAPKGLAIVGDYLYVSDVNEFVKIDIKKARIIETVHIKDSKFLNDVVADTKGNIYVSDMFENAIHVWTKKGIKPWVVTPKLRGPNGLYTDGSEHILSVSWGNPIDLTNFQTKELGALTTISLKKPSPTISEDLTLRGNLDGIDSDNNGNLWISDWMNGDVYKMKKDGSFKKLYNFGQGTADLSVAKDLNILLIPQMYQNKVIAIKIK